MDDSGRRAGYRDRGADDRLGRLRMPWTMTSFSAGFNKNPSVPKSNSFARWPEETRTGGCGVCDEDLQRKDLLGLAGIDVQMFSA
mgnify:CR=1 FL=1